MYINICIYYRINRYTYVCVCLRAHVRVDGLSFVRGDERERSALSSISSVRLPRSPPPPSLAKRSAKKERKSTTSAP